MSDWHVYILECADGTFYTGITKNLDLRVDKHNKGVASKYTRGRLPVTLAYTETTTNRSTASTRESEIKSLTREQKAELISPKL